jgi:hypothetical protein
MGPRSKPPSPAMARQPVAPPDSCTSLPLMGQATFTDAFPFQMAISTPKPRKNERREKINRIFDFMAHAQA